MSIVTDDFLLESKIKGITPKVVFSGINQQLAPFINIAKQRIFSLAAGDKVAKIAPKIMELGLGKILYAVNEFGIDVEASNAFVLFAPDGTISYNIERIKRGFTYGAILNLEFDGMIATSNSMPNGCGFSMYEIENPMSDLELMNFLGSAQQRLGKDQLSQLGKGNHFAGVYYVKDPETGEDTNRRFVVIHCSGHVGGDRLYYPETWLKDIDGFYSIQTPHGSIDLLEGEAKKLYNSQFLETETANAKNRDITMREIFNDHPWKKLEEITHQGLIDGGRKHIIGTQKHEGMMPIAFNPEEGLVAVKTLPNLSREFMDQWKQGERIRNLGFENEFSKLNLTPHGGGYEFVNPLKEMEIELNSEGVEIFNLKFENKTKHHSFHSFREIRDWMTYRRRAPIMNKVEQANLAEIIYELPGLKQVYPIKSIPGGSHG